MNNKELENKIKILKKDNLEKDNIIKKLETKQEKQIKEIKGWKVEVYILEHELLQLKSNIESVLFNMYVVQDPVCIDNKDLKKRLEAKLKRYKV